MRELSSNILSYLKENNASQTIIFNIPIEQSFQTSLNIFNVLKDSSTKIIYITLVHDSLKLKNIFRANNLDDTQVTYIDGISRLYGSKEVSSDQIHYITGPLALDQIATETEKQLQQNTDHKHLIILDCLTALLLYNHLDQTVEFVQRMDEIIKKNRGIGIFIVYNNSKAIQTLFNRMKRDTKILNFSE